MLLSCCEHLFRFGTRKLRCERWRKTTVRRCSHQVWPHSYPCSWRIFGRYSLKVMRIGLEESLLLRGKPRTGPQPSELPNVSRGRTFCSCSMLFRCLGCGTGVTDDSLSKPSRRPGTRQTRVSSSEPKVDPSFVAGSVDDGQEGKSEPTVKPWAKPRQKKSSMSLP